MYKEFGGVKLPIYEADNPWGYYGFCYCSKSPLRGHRWDKGA